MPCPRRRLRLTRTIRRRRPSVRGRRPAEEPAPAGPGWVVQLRGYHLHNNDLHNSGSVFLRDTLIKNLNEAIVELPGKDGKLAKVSIKDLGISHPVIVSQIGTPRTIPYPAGDPIAEGTRNPDGSVTPAKVPELKRFDFIVQFAWRPTPLSKRLEAEELKAKEKAQAGALAVDGAAPAEGN